MAKAKNWRMERLRMRIGLVGLALALLSTPVYAKGGGHGGHSSGSVHVSSYSRRDGTSVSSHYRSAPGTGTAGSGYGGSYSSGSSSYSSPSSTISTPDYHYSAPPVAPDPAAVAASRAEAAGRLLLWQRDLADKGNAHGQYSMGLRHLKGDGVERNEDLGRAWLRKAAKQGHSEAYQTLKNTDFFESKRDEHGRIERSSSARSEFMDRTGYPHGRPGYVIDHIVALKRGGCDCRENMQWQTIEAAKEKDKWE